VVILTPESGDAIQALKAGLMEIAEVIVLNKSDLPGADAMEAALRASLAFRPEGHRPPIVRTVATAGKGLDELHEKLREHRDYVNRPEVAATRRREKTRARIRNAVREGLLDAWLKRQGLDALLEDAAGEVIAGRTSPYRAARDLIERMTRHGERSNGNHS
jgi:LAO/AO transport system kinase